MRTSIVPVPTRRPDASKRSTPSGSSGSSVTVVPSGPTERPSIVRTHRKVPGVGDDIRYQPLAAVQRLRVEGALLHPEGTLEFLVQRLGAIVELDRPAGMAFRDDLGKRAHRRDRVRLHLDRRDRSAGALALRVEVAVAGRSEEHTSELQ